MQLKGLRRRIIENMADRRRTFSPQYTPLLEEEEPLEDSEAGSDDNDAVLKTKGNHRTSSQVEYEERVVILSDQDTSKDRSNGDADSGISISEVAGEEHPTGRVSVINTMENSESLIALIIQIVIPFFFAGFGMMAAGLLLDTVQVS